MSESVATAIVIGQRNIPYRLVRSASARKLKLAMTMDEFRVTAPIDVSELDIRQALSQKHKWIIESYAALQEKYEQTHKVARFRTGAKLPYWGRLSLLRTQLADVDSINIRYKNGFYVEHPNFASSEEHDDKVEAALHNYLKERFTLDAKSFANSYSQKLGIQPKSLRVVEMSRRWGSCTDSGNVSLDWRLVYAPKRVAAYVVAHELTHLKINNHGRQFWKLLQSVYGEHTREYEWLQKNEHLLGYRKLFVKVANE
jgi:predicted metal-dependent hydrolase